MAAALVPVSAKANDRKILIIYWSRSGNTRSLAQFIQKQTKAEILELRLVTPYPEDYRATVNQVVRENASGYLPPIKTPIPDLKAYDTIFIGFPIWDMKLPPPIKSLLHQHSLTGKKVIPFCTHGGYGKGQSFQMLKELCKNCTLLEGFAIEGKEVTGAELATQKWLDKILNSKSVKLE